MQPGRLIGAILPCLLLINFACGCASFRSARSGKSAEKLYAVTAASAPFYSHSPRQGIGPDKTIPRDTAMKVIRFSSGFCKVHLLSGEEGFVASEDIASAGARVGASLNDPSQSLASSSAWRAEIPQPRSNAPEAPLPEYEPAPIEVPVNPGN